jgi:hypothetical protein
MRSFNFGCVLLLGVVFAAPACKVEAHLTSGANTGGDAGTSGGGKSGSAGQGGSTGGSGAADTGGASGAAETAGAAGDHGGAAGSNDDGGAAGSSDDGGAGESADDAGAGGLNQTCDTSGFEFPEVTCPTGSVSELTNPTCQDVFLCLGLADCAASNMDCGLCLDYLKVAFDDTDTCIESATQTTLADACTRLAQDSAGQYPQCAPK